MTCFICNGATKVIISEKLYWCDNCLNNAIGGRLTTPEETIEEAYAKSIEAKISLVGSADSQDNPFASIELDATPNQTLSIDDVPILSNGERDPTYCSYCYRSGHMSIITEYRVTTSMHFEVDFPDYEEEEIQISAFYDSEEENYRNAIENMIQCSYCGTIKSLDSLPFTVEFV